MTKDFDINCTRYCKGIGIILMVIHHLFCGKMNIELIINGVSIEERAGVVGKTCISLFLILSGLGIYLSNVENFNLKEFYYVKVRKLYLNYLFIVISSAIIGIIFFPNSFKTMVPFNIIGILKFLLTCTGLQYLFNYNGYNCTWWFFTLILILYIFFPLIRKCVKKYKGKFVLIYFIISFIGIIKCNYIGQILSLISWSFAYILGVYIAGDNRLNKIKSFLLFNKFRRVSSILVLIFCIYLRQLISASNFLATKLELLLALLIILNVYINYDKIRFSKNFMIYLGKKSMNIYYIHIFVIAYYLQDIIYSIKSSICKIIFVFIISIIWGDFLDFLKSMLKKFKNVNN